MALDGFFFDGVCFRTEQDAYNEYGASLQPVITPLKQVVFDYLPSYALPSFTGAFQKTETTFDDLGVVVNSYQSIVGVPAFMPCDPDQGYLDGLTIGWGIGGLYIAVASLMLIKKAFP